MKAFLNDLLKNAFYKKVGILISGTVISRALMFASLPIVTRLYTPNDFEILAVFMATISIIGVVVNLRFNMAITLPREDSVAINLLALSLLSATVIGIVLACSVLFSQGLLSAMLGQPDFFQYEWMIPAGVVLVGGYQALQYWASRKHQFLIIAKTRVYRAIGGVVAQLGFGAVVIGPLGLLAGHMVYSGLGIVGLARNLLFNDKKSYFSVSMGAMRKAAVAYKRFPFYSVPEALANTAGVYVPVIIIASYAGSDGGYLALAMQVLVIPMALVGQSVSQVFMAEAPKRHRDGTLKRFTWETGYTMFKLGAAVLIPVGIISPSVFPLLFGSNWEAAGSILLIMIPWHILQLTASPISTVLHVIGLLHYAMLLQVLGAILRIGSVLFAIQFYPNSLITAYAISGAIFYTIYISLILGVTRTLK